MKKIGIIINVSFEETGVSTYLKTLLESIDGKDNYVLIVNNESWDDYLKFKSLRIGFYNKSKFNYFYKLIVLFNLKRLGGIIFRNVNPLGRFIQSCDVSQFIFPTACYLTFFIDNTSCVSIHDLMHLTEGNRESSSFIKKYFRNNIYNNIALKFAKIIFESEFGRNMFFNYYKMNKTSNTYILPYCCPSYIVNILEKNLHSRYDITKYGSYFFYPASFWSHKNHIRLIHAFSNLIIKGFDFNILFSGGLNKDYNKLKKLVSDLGLNNRVIFTGYVNDEEIVALYVGSQALIMPTFFGPTNIPPIEAIYCDTPVLISGIYGMKEQMEDVALYFDPTSIIDIERSLHEFLKTERSDLINKGRLLRSKFSFELFKSKLEYVINENHE